MAGRCTSGKQSGCPRAPAPFCPLTTGRKEPSGENTSLYKATSDRTRTGEEQSATCNCVSRVKSKSNKYSPPKYVWPKSVFNQLRLPATALTGPVSMRIWGIWLFDHFPSSLAMVKEWNRIWLCDLQRHVKDGPSGHRFSFSLSFLFSFFLTLGGVAKHPFFHTWTNTRQALSWPYYNLPQ